MPHDTDNMLRKIKALLAKAEDRAVTPEEAQLYSARAAELMAKYSIDLALIDGKKPKQDRDKPGRYTLSWVGVKYLHRKKMLLHNIAVSYNVMTIGSSTPTRTIIFGFKSDVDLAVMLYRSLILQAHRALVQAKVPPNDSLRSFRASWWNAYVSRVIERINEAAVRGKQEAVKTPGAQLVLASRELEVRRAFDAEYPNIKARYVTLTGRSQAGWQQGTEAANRADLGGPRLGATMTSVRSVLA